MTQYSCEYIYNKMNNNNDTINNIYILVNKIYSVKN